MKKLKTPINKRENVFFRKYLLFKFLLMDFIDYVKYDIIYVIKNYLSWFKTIKNLTIWHHSSLYDVMDKQLSQLEKSMVSYYEKDEKNNLKYIKICLELLKRLKSDYYTDEIYEYVIMKYHFIKNGTVTGMKSEMIKNDLIKYFKKYPLQVKRFTKKGVVDETLLAYEVSMFNQEKARKLFFKIMGEKLNKFGV